MVKSQYAIRAVRIKLFMSPDLRVPIVYTTRLTPNKAINSAGVVQNKRLVGSSAQHVRNFCQQIREFELARQCTLNHLKRDNSGVNFSVTPKLTPANLTPETSWSYKDLGVMLYVAVKY